MLCVRSKNDAYRVYIKVNIIRCSVANQINYSKMYRIDVENEKKTKEEVEKDEQEMNESYSLMQCFD